MNAKVAGQNQQVKLFTGPMVAAKRIDHLVHPVDIAQTLSAYLRAKLPSGAMGKPLFEVLKR